MPSPSKADPQQESKEGLDADTDADRAHGSGVSESPLLRRGSFPLVFRARSPRQLQVPLTSLPMSSRMAIEKSSSRLTKLSPPQSSMRVSWNVVSSLAALRNCSLAGGLSHVPLPFPTPSAMSDWACPNGSRSAAITSGEA